MKPAWDKLMTNFQGSATVVVADVDCTADEAKSVCEAQGVSGYPTIKYYNSTTGDKGEDYSGGRDFKALKKFVRKVLKGTERVCEAASREGCFPEEIEILSKWDKEPREARAARLKALDAKLDTVLKADERKKVELEAKMLRVLEKGEKAGGASAEL
mmetsp:Transcript_21057/g.42338  ORF Transcript_21057/g.42338 Transcript_21057/m.42338 type:complete len:157 (+) Transcript_21057:211-681(+)